MEEMVLIEENTQPIKGQTIGVGFKAMPPVFPGLLHEFCAVGTGLNLMLFSKRKQTQIVSICGGEF